MDHLDDIGQWAINTNYQAPASDIGAQPQDDADDSWADAELSEAVICYARPKPRKLDASTEHTADLARRVRNKS